MKHLILLSVLLCTSANVFAGDSLPSPQGTALTSLPLSRHEQVLEAIREDGKSVPPGVVAVVLDRSDSSLIIVWFQQKDSVASRRVSLDSSLVHRAGLTNYFARDTVLLQDGRVYFMTHTTVKSLPLYLSGFSVALDGLDSRVAAGIGLLSVGGSLYGSYRFSRGKKLGYGKVAMMNYGGELGIIYPVLAGQLLGSATSLGAREAENVGAWGSMAGFPLGIYLGERYPIVEYRAYGNAAIIRDLSRAGLLYGYVLPIAFDISGGDYQTVSSLLSMALIPAGFYTGYKLVGERGVSSGRAVMTTTASILGALSGLAVPSWFRVESSRVYAASALAGHALGTGFGLTFRSTRSYSLGKGVVTALSAVVGGGVGAAIPFLFQANDDRGYTIAATIGVWGGFVMGEAFATELIETESRLSARSLQSMTLHAGNLALVPLLLSMRDSNRSEKKLNFRIPLLSGSF